MRSLLKGWLSNHYQTVTNIPNDYTAFCGKLKSLVGGQVFIHHLVGYIF